MKSLKELLQMLPPRDLSMYDGLRLTTVHTFKHGHAPSKLCPQKSGPIRHPSNTLVQHVYPFHTFKHSLKHRVVKRVGQHV